MATSQRSSSDSEKDTPAESSEEPTAKPVWNTATQGPPPAGREDQYEYAPPAGEVPLLGATGKPIDTSSSDK